MVNISALGADDSRFDSAAPDQSRHSKFSETNSALCKFLAIGGL